MGFFQELKDDLSQAVNELVPDSELETVDLPQEEEVTAFDEETFVSNMEQEIPSEEPVEDLDDIMANLSQEQESTMETAGETEISAASEEVMFEEVNTMETVQETVEEPVYGGTPVSEPAPSSYDYKSQSTSDYGSSTQLKEAPPIPIITDVPTDEVSDEVGVITKMMTINGDLVSNGSLDLIGAVRGNINIRGKLNVTGNLIGDANAAEVYAQEAQIVGNITSTGTVKVGQNTVIRGNIYAKSAVIAGAVKGDIDVHGPVIIDSTAIVMGNIKSKAVQINNGAAIEGMCSQCYADVSPTNFFKD